MDFRFRYRRKPPSPEELAGEEQKQEDKVAAARGLAVGYSIPAALLSGPLAGWLIGSWLEQRFGGTLWLPLCIVLGTAAGFATMIRMLALLGRKE